MDLDQSREAASGVCPRDCTIKSGLRRTSSRIMYPFRAVAFELDSRAWSTGDFHLVLRPGLFAPWAERTRQTYPTLGFWRNGETLICFASEFLDIEPSCPPPVGTARVFRGGHDRRPIRCSHLDNRLSDPTPRRFSLIGESPEIRNSLVRTSSPVEIWRQCGREHGHDYWRRCKMTWKPCGKET